VTADETFAVEAAMDAALQMAKQDVGVSDDSPIRLDVDHAAPVASKPVEPHSATTFDESLGSNAVRPGTADRSETEGSSTSRLQEELQEIEHLKQVAATREMQLHAQLQKALEVEDAGKDLAQAAPAEAQPRLEESPAADSQAGLEETPAEPQSGLKEAPAEAQAGLAEGPAEPQPGLEEAPAEAQAGLEETPAGAQAGAMAAEAHGGVEISAVAPAGLEEPPSEAQAGLEESPVEPHVTLEEPTEVLETLTVASIEEAARLREVGLQRVGEQAKAQERQRLEAEERQRVDVERQRALQDLVARKEAAAAAEDYDLAKQLKAEIEALYVEPNAVEGAGNVNVEAAEHTAVAEKVVVETAVPDAQSSLNRPEAEVALARLAAAEPSDPLAAAEAALARADAHTEVADGAKVDWMQWALAQAEQQRANVAGPGAPLPNRLQEAQRAAALMDEMRE
jgi:hypothetical protein